jgi:hypothetical protein
LSGRRRDVGLTDARDIADTRFWNVMKQTEIAR